MLDDSIHVICDKNKVKNVFDQILEQKKLDFIELYWDCITNSRGNLLEECSQHITGDYVK